MELDLRRLQELQVALSDLQGLLQDPRWKTMETYAAIKHAFLARQLERPDGPRNSVAPEHVAALRAGIDAWKEIEQLRPASPGVLAEIQKSLAAQARKEKTDGNQRQQGQGDQEAG